MATSDKMKSAVNSQPWAEKKYSELHSEVSMILTLVFALRNVNKSL